MCIFPSWCDKSLWFCHIFSNLSATPMYWRSFAAQTAYVLYTVMENLATLNSLNRITLVPQLLNEFSRYTSQRVIFWKTKIRWNFWKIKAFNAKLNSKSSITWQGNSKLIAGKHLLTSQEIEWNRARAMLYMRACRYAINEYCRNSRNHHTWNTTHEILHMLYFEI